MLMLELDPWHRDSRRMRHGLMEDFGYFSPDVDVSETDRQLEVTAELPGLDEGDIDVTLTDGVLTVKGEKRAETEELGVDKHHHCLERSYGAFRRSFGLPPEIDIDDVSARFDKGVLKIIFPKKSVIQAEAFTPPAPQFQFWLLPPPGGNRFRNGRPIRPLVRAVRRFLRGQMLQVLRLGRH